MKITLDLSWLLPFIRAASDAKRQFQMRTCNPLAPHFGEYIIKQGTRKGIWQ